ncbi:hypothetical protein L6232_23815, partial [Shewanella sp. C31]|nr:hypothetical protein [Shewanella electrica]
PPALLVIDGDVAFAGNPGLCVGGRSELGVCQVEDGRRAGLARRSLVLVPVLVSATLLLVVGILFVSYRSFKLEELKNRDMEQGGGCGAEW